MHSLAISPTLLWLCPAAQMRDEYSGLQGFKPREAAGAVRGAPAAAAKSAAAAAAADSKSHTAKLIDSIPAQRWAGVLCLLNEAACCRNCWPAAVSCPSPWCPPAGPQQQPAKASSWWYTAAVRPLARSRLRPRRR